MKTKFTQAEWFEVAKLAKPEITQTAFDVMWDEFINFKSLTKFQQRAYLDAV